MCLIESYYTVPAKIKTEEQVDREKWLVRPCLKFNRWWLMPVAFLIQLCCGSLFAWSVFNKPIDHLIGGPNTKMNAAPVTFYVAIGFFGVASVLTGPWLERKGPKVTCVLGIILVVTGHLITALALWLQIMPLVYVGYGGFAGAGFGICYISPVPALQKWFPDRRGFASGFATCGFGAGTVFYSKIQIPMMDTMGLPLTFVALGVMFVVVVTTSALVLRTPPTINYHPRNRDSAIVTNTAATCNTGELLTSTVLAAVLKAKPLPSTEPDKLRDAMPVTGVDGVSGAGQGDSNTAIALTVTEDPVGPRTSDQRFAADTVEIVLNEIPYVETSAVLHPPLMVVLVSADFRLMFVMFVSHVTFGLLLSARLSNIVIDVFHKTPNLASSVVSTVALVNFVGRLSISILSDYIGPKYVFAFMLALQVTLLGFFSTMTNNQMFVTFWITMSVLMAVYGAGFGVISAFLTDRFGPTNISACHGIFIAGFAAVGVLGGLIFTLTFDYFAFRHPPSDPILYNVNAWWVFGVACIGLIASLFVKPTSIDLRTKMRVKNWIKKLFKIR